MKYNPAIHHRRSIRLKGHDYSQPGLYFITLCTQNSLHLFSEITNDKMVLDNAGMMVEKWWQRNYYEHIIRNEKSYLNISEYIKTNPLK